MTNSFDIYLKESSKEAEMVNSEDGSIPGRIGKTKKKYELLNDGYIPWRWALMLLGAGCVLYYCVYLIDNMLPTVVTIREADENPNLFSGERSMHILTKLTDLGERNVGSEANEVLAPQVIIREIEDIRESADPSQSIQYEIQKGDGALSFRYSSYQNIQNVIALLQGSNGTHGIVVNCHYDSGASSIGASDNALNCAVMLELLRVFSKSKIRLKHNIVFLFNGAEEVGLMGSHLFLTHKWANLVDAVINLEAAGLGGRAILFQSGPENSWLFKYYARNAPHPHGQVTGEELFQSGIIPSDTDFRIFRDYGKMPGLDFAFNRNGYVYHTIYDRPEYILGGCHQHMGENLLAVLKKLGHAKELEDIDKYKEGSMVFFDYLGWFMVRYSYEAGIAINILVFLLAVAAVSIFMGRLLEWSWLPQSMGHLEKIRDSKLFRKPKGNQLDITSTNVATTSEEGNESFQEKMNEFETTNNWLIDEEKLSWKAACWELFLATMVRFFSMGFVLAVNCLMGLFIDAAAPLAMPYFSNIYLIFPYYWCPGLAAYALFPMLFDLYRERKCTLTFPMRCQLNLAASLTVWGLILFIGTCSQFRSMAIVMVPVLFASLALLTIHLTQLYKTVYAWIWVYIFVNLPAIFLQLYAALQIYVLFIPVTGRSGPINGDLYISMITAVLILYTCSYIIPLMTVVKKPWMVLAVLVAFAFLMLPVALPTDIGHPYHKGPGSPMPQRYFVTHRDLKFYNESGKLFRHNWGYMISDQDRNSPRTMPDHLSRGMVEYSTDMCKDIEVYCEIMSSNKHWIPTVNPPNLPSPVEIVFHEKNWNNGSCHFKFSFKGPDRLSIWFSPRDGGYVTEWTVPSDASPAKNKKGNNLYTIFLVRGEVADDYHLEFKVNMPSGINSCPVLDIQILGSFIHHQPFYSPAFAAYLDDFPDFVTMQADMSSYVSQIY